MIKTRAAYAAVRHLGALVAYEHNNKAKSLLRVGQGSGWGGAFKALQETPYKKEAKMTRILKLEDECFTRTLGSDWYKVLLVPGGLDLLYSAIFENLDISENIATVTSDSSLNTSDRILDYFYIKEITYTTEQTVNAD